MKALIYLLGLVICFFSMNACNSNDKTQDTKVSSSVVDSKEKTNYIRGKYHNASMYAAATFYYFITDERDTILVKESFDTNAKNPNMPDNMLETLEDPSDGPPEGNPELIGKYFKLYQDKAGAFTNIVLED